MGGKNIIYVELWWGVWLSKLFEFGLFVLVNNIRFGVMKLSLLLLLTGSSLFADPTFEQYKQHFISVEGINLKPYKCSKGFNTVGIGHKFERGELIKQSYSINEINSLFKNDLIEAKAIARKVFISFDKQPDNVQIMLTALCYNMGEGGIKKFIKFRSAINSNNYSRAANELQNSKWFSQVKGRGVKYVTILRNT